MGKKLKVIIERVQSKSNLKIDSALNDYKSILLENEKPHLSEEIIYFLENDLENISTSFFNQKIDDLFAPIYFAKRSYLEYLQMQRHPINYCVVNYIDNENKSNYLIIHREKGSGETRLIGKKGLLGGHVGTEDIVLVNGSESVDIVKTLEKALLRELEEEAGIKKDIIKNNKFYGFIKSDIKKTTEYDHLGIVSVLEVKTKNIKTLEDGIISGSWFTKEEIIDNISTFEEWSQIVFKNLFSL